MQFSLFLYSFMQFLTTNFSEFLLLFFGLDLSFFLLEPFSYELLT
jgi:hypothetical protein